MRILLTNDDGIHAPGIHALHAALRECGHEVHVVAPLKENSGVSASLTLRGRLHVYDVEEDGLVGQAVDGTPADCVKLALTTLLRDAPDLVVAGLNNGGNLGTDVFYSGTVGAAVEACMFGLPAAAVSRGRPAEEPPAACAAHAARLVTAFDWAGFPRGRVLNINYPRRPAAEWRGVRAAAMSLTPWSHSYDRHEEPAGQPGWELVGSMPPEDGTETDIALVRAGWVVLTPLLLDRTDRATLARLGTEEGGDAAPLS